MTLDHASERINNFTRLVTTFVAAKRSSDQGEKKNFAHSGPVLDSVQAYERWVGKVKTALQEIPENARDYDRIRTACIDMFDVYDRTQETEEAIDNALKLAGLKPPHEAARPDPPTSAPPDRDL